MTLNEYLAAREALFRNPTDERARACGRQKAMRLQSTRPSRWRRSTKPACNGSTRQTTCWPRAERSCSTTATGVFPTSARTRQRPGTPPAKLGLAPLPSAAPTTLHAVHGQWRSLLSHIVLIGSDSGCRDDPGAGVVIVIEGLDRSSPTQIGGQVLGGHAVPATPAFSTPANVRRPRLSA